MCSLWLFWVKCLHLHSDLTPSDFDGFVWTTALAKRVKKRMNRDAED